MNDPINDLCERSKPTPFPVRDLSLRTSDPAACLPEEQLASPSSNTIVPGLSVDALPLFYQPPPEDSPLAPMLQHRPVLRQRSSHLQRWIEEQKRISNISSDPESEDEEVAPLQDDVPSPAGTNGNPSLASPHLNHLRSWSLQRGKNLDDKETLDSYIIIDDDEVNCAEDARRASIDQDDTDEVRPDTPAFSSSADVSSSNRSCSRKRSALLRAPSPLRNLHIQFPSSRRISSSSTGTFSLSPFSPINGSAPASRSGTPTGVFGHSRAANAWRLRRPNVLGHFYSASEPHGPAAGDEADVARPRPSFSSTVTYSSATTGRTYSSDAPATPRTLSFGSARTLPLPFVKSSSPPSLFSVTGSDPQFDENGLAQKYNALRRPFPLKPSTNGNNVPATVPTTMHFGSRMNVSNVLNTPKHRRKKKLVIVGIGLNEPARFEAVKRWCESFGELSQITRMPNGDIYVHFRKAEVADQVCKLNARVRIDGVGSVCLSWFTGKRPS